MKTQSNQTPQIYIACLAAYNAGQLHGKWIDATQDIDDIWDDIKSILASSPEENAEEWAIHDYEDFGKIRLSEYEAIEKIHAIACFIEEHGEIGAALLSHYDENIEDAQNALDNYMGCYNSLSDYAAELTEQTTTIPPNLVHYIDYEAIARDMELNGEVFTIEESWDKMHVFLNH